MLIKNPPYLVLFLCFLLGASITTKAQTNVIPDNVELAVLKNIYDSLGGSGWITKTNWPTLANWPASATSAQFGTWSGVTVTNGDISKISFINNNLTGQIPNSISQLTKLRYIYLQKNTITGPIPTSFGKLVTVTNMLLDHNSLSGSIPTALGNMSSLVQITLNNNFLSGAIPSSLGNLTSLDMLNAGYNQLTGTIPSTLSQLSIATYIYLNNNQLTGSLPSSLSSKLLYFNVNNNQLNGTIPSSYSGLKDLLIFDVSFNQLTGSFPDVSQWTSVTQINVANNLLTGAIPASVGSCASLAVLRGENNSFTSLPANLLSLPVLNTCFFSNNDINAIPDFSTQVNKVNLTLQVNKNKLDFGQLEMIFNKGIKSLAYNQQKNLDDLSFIRTSPGGSITIPARSAGINGTITWQRKLDGSSTWVTINTLNSDATQKTFQRANNQFTDAGEYIYKLTNSVITGMTIQSTPIKIRVGYDEVWTGIKDVLDATGILTKISADGWTNAGARSKNILAANTDGWFEFVVNQSNNTADFIIGFSSINNNYTQSVIEFGVGVNAQNGLRLFSYESSATGTDLGACVVGDVIRISRIASTVKYFKNGVEIGGINVNAAKYYSVKAIINKGTIPQVLSSFASLNETGDLPDALEFSLLKEIFDNMGGAAWTNKTNWPVAGSWPTTATSAQFGTWFGVTVENGDINKISLENNNLVGAIPASIGTFSSLKEISLVNNKINGTIPASIGNLSTLQRLNLENNLLTGSMPVELTTLTNLSLLHLNGNQLSGTIPTELNNLVNLTDLNL
jgi:Leucine-rich repeat (LRR) protein